MVKGGHGGMVSMGSGVSGLSSPWLGVHGSMEVMAFHGGFDMKVSILSKGLAT